MVAPTSLWIRVCSSARWLSLSTSLCSCAMVAAHLRHSQLQLLNSAVVITVDTDSVEPDPELELDRLYISGNVIWKKYKYCISPGA